jgi:hypothetical protein
LLLVLLLQLALFQPVKLLLHRVVHEVCEVRDALALVRALQQVPFLRALHVNQ